MRAPQGEDLGHVTPGKSSWPSQGGLVHWENLLQTVDFSASHV